ncbi:endonuclease domain-containing protein [Streptomyces sp. NPDC127097]|uniref:endonuclease domain-containing protein n=1 Tax=Streptomyces sp. NPDC127097 TaxID=3347136 RepID=UPI00364C4A74
MARRREICEFDDEYWCEICEDPIDYGEKGRVKGHCSACSVAVRQARRHGLTVWQMNAILRVQDDECALCGQHPGDSGTEGVSFWHIDHDHTHCPNSGSCGRCVRGLLCKACNLYGISWYERLPPACRDSPRLNAYLADPPARRPEAAVSTWGDVTGIRARDGAFASWRSSRPLEEGSDI